MSVASPDLPGPARWRPRVPSSVATLPREVKVLGVVAFCVAVGFGIVAPAIPLFARTFGVGHEAAAAVIAIFAAMRLVSALGVGRLVNAMGPRRMLATGMAVVAISSVLAGLAQSYVQLLVLRGLGGVGSAMFTVSASALMLASTPPEQRGQASGFFSGGFLLGGITGPAFGGLVTGVSPRAPFFLYAVALAAAGTVGFRMLPDAASHKAAARTAEQTLTLRRAFALPAYRAALAANLADSWAVIGVRSALLPLFVAESLHRRPVWTGIGFLVVAGTNAATLLPGGRLVDTIGRRPLLAAGCMLSGAGMLVLVVTHGLPLFFLAMVVIGVGSGLLDVAPGAVLGDTLGKSKGGTVVAAYQMAGDAGAVTGPLVAGRLADQVGFPTAFGVTAGVLFAAGALALTAPETKPRVPSDHGGSG